jgi:hypothetical protein
MTRAAADAADAYIAKTFTTGVSVFWAIAVINGARIDEPMPRGAKKLIRERLARALEA